MKWKNEFCTCWPVYYWDFYWLLPLFHFLRQKSQKRQSPMLPASSGWNLRQLRKTPWSPSLRTCGKAIKAYVILRSKMTCRRPSCLIQSRWERHLTKRSSRWCGISHKIFRCLKTAPSWLSTRWESLHLLYNSAKSPRLSWPASSWIA